MSSEFPHDVGQPPKDVGQPPAGSGMIDRIKRIILTPKAEWPAIAAAPMTVQSILTGWVLPLAAIGIVASVVRGFLSPLVNPFTGQSFYPSPIGAIVGAIVQLAFVVGGVFLWSLVIDALAPNFKGVKNSLAALKLVAFSMTAAWLCGIFQISWITLPLAIAGLYSLYLFWVGVPVMMKVPEDQAPAYVAVCALIGIVAGAVVGLVLGMMTAAMFAMAPSNALSSNDGVKLTLPGGTTVDTSQIKDVAKSLEDASKGGGKAAADPAALAALLPGAISGWTRTETSNGGGGAMGFNGSGASATFTAGDQSFQLKITDTNVLGGLAGLANVTENKQTATGYEKTELVNGQMTTEKWNTESKSGQYGVLVGKRFMVEAEGSAPSIDVLKAAVASVSAAQLEAMAK